MDAETRRRLHILTLKFINSPAFIEYIGILYEGASSEDRLELQRAYSSCMAGARVEQAYVYMANTQLTSKQVQSAAALIMVGAEGSSESEAKVGAAYLSLSLGVTEGLSTRSQKKIEARLRDQDYKAFRCTPLPSDLTKNHPMYFIDAMLAQDNFFDHNGVEVPMVPCLVNPEAEVTIFAIPREVIDQVARTSDQALPVREYFQPINYLTSVDEQIDKLGPRVSLIAHVCLVLAVLCFILSFFSGAGILAVVPLFGAFIGLIRILVSGGKRKGLKHLGVATLLSILAIWGSANYTVKQDPAEERVKTPLEEAETTLYRTRKPDVLRGNTAEANQVAQQISAALSARDKDSQTPPLFVQLNEESSAVIFRVSNIRKMSSEEKQVLVDQLWQVSSETLLGNERVEGSSFAIGVKGLLLYERILIGELRPQTDADQPRGILQEESITHESLDPFFPAVNSQPQELPEAEE